MISTEELVDRLRQSRLLSSERLAKLERTLSGSQSAEQLTRRLLSAKWLTRWQLAQIVANKPVWVGPYKLLDRLTTGRSGPVYVARWPYSLPIIPTATLASRAALDDDPRPEQENFQPGHFQPGHFPSGGFQAGDLRADLANFPSGSQQNDPHQLDALQDGYQQNVGQPTNSQSPAGQYPSAQQPSAQQVVDLQAAKTAGLVVVKMWPIHHFPSQVDRDRLIYEARAVAGVEHPALIRLVDAGFDQHRAWIAREYVRGVDLKTARERVGPLPVRWTCECIRQVALALQQGSLHQLAHGHLQPEKILALNPDFRQLPTVKLLGLGLSHALRRPHGDFTVTRADQLPSGAAYMAPEYALHGGQPTVQADLYALGVILFELLCGRLPFEGNDLMSIWYARFERAPLPPRQFRPELPVQLDTLFERALARDPSRRLQTPGELAATLALFGHGEEATDQALVDISSEDDARDQPNPFTDSAVLGPSAASLASVSMLASLARIMAGQTPAPAGTPPPAQEGSKEGSTASPASAAAGESPSEDAFFRNNLPAPPNTRSPGEIDKPAFGSEVVLSPPAPEDSSHGGDWLGQEIGSSSVFALPEEDSADLTEFASATPQSPFEPQQATSEQATSEQVTSEQVTSEISAAQESNQLTEDQLGTEQISTEEISADSFPDDSFPDDSFPDDLTQAEALQLEGAQPESVLSEELSSDRASPAPTSEIQAEEASGHQPPLEQPTLEQPSSEQPSSEQTSSEQTSSEQVTAGWPTPLDGQTQEDQSGQREADALEISGSDILSPAAQQGESEQEDFGGPTSHQLIDPVPELAELQPSRSPAESGAPVPQAGASAEAQSNADDEILNTKAASPELAESARSDQQPEPEHVGLAKASPEELCKKPDDFQIPPAQVSRDLEDTTELDLKDLPFPTLEEDSQSSQQGLAGEPSSQDQTATNVLEDDFSIANHLRPGTRGSSTAPPHRGGSSGELGEHGFTSDQFPDQTELHAEFEPAPSTFDWVESTYSSLEISFDHLPSGEYHQEQFARTDPSEDDPSSYPPEIAPNSLEAGPENHAEKTPDSSFMLSEFLKVVSDPSDPQTTDQATLGSSTSPASNSPASPSQSKAGPSAAPKEPQQASSETSAEDLLAVDLPGASLSAMDPSDILGPTDPFFQAENSSEAHVPLGQALGDPAEEHEQDDRHVSALFDDFGLNLSRTAGESSTKDPRVGESHLDRLIDDASQVGNSTADKPGQPGPGQLTPGQLIPGQLTPGQLVPGQSASGQQAASSQPPDPGYDDQEDATQITRQSDADADEVSSNFEIVVGDSAIEFGSPKASSEGLESLEGSSEASSMAFDPTDFDTAAFNPNTFDSGVGWARRGPSTDSTVETYAEIDLPNELDASSQTDHPATSLNESTYTGSSSESVVDLTNELLTGSSGDSVVDLTASSALDSASERVLDSTIRAGSGSAVATFDPEAIELLRRVEECGLITGPRLAEFRRSSSMQPGELIDSFVLVDVLVSSGLLSQWQANELAAGRTEVVIDGYHLVDALPPDDYDVMRYQGWHPEHGNVLLKVVPADQVLGSDAVARLERDIRLSQLVTQQGDCPCVARVVGHGQTEKVHYLAVEACGSRPAECGRPLDEWLRSHSGPVPADWACDVIRQAALGAESIHQAQLVHRCLSPQSVLVAGESFQDPPQVKLLGFGYAHSEQQNLKGPDITQVEDLIGHADYLAPEQGYEAAELLTASLAGHEIDARSDVYALGSLLFRLLSGAVAFDGASDQEKIDLKKTSEPPQLAWVMRDISPDLDYVTSIAMSREPTGRYKTAAELANALEPFALSTAPPGARPTRPPVSVEVPDSSMPESKDRGEDVANIFRRLRETGLIDEETLPAARRAAEGLSNGQLYLNRLVDRSLVSRWQARQLQEGREEFILGRYRLLDQLSQGPTTETFLAEELASAQGSSLASRVSEPGGLKRRVVIKALNRESASDDNDVTRFRRAGRLAATLAHEHLIPVLKTVEVTARPYQVMPYIPGRNLRDILRLWHRLPVGWACECARQAALALHYLASAGVVHRDIQPSNLYITLPPEGKATTLKVLGLGTAMPEDREIKGESVTQMGELIGTAEYTAPEQAESPSAVDIRADIYALGGTLFHLLTGRLPFEGPSAVARLTARFKGDLPQARQLRPEVPVELEALLNRTLAPNREERLASPAELAAALEPFCEPLPSDLADLAVRTPANTGHQETRHEVASGPRSVPDLVRVLEETALLPADQLGQARNLLQPVEVLDNAIDQLVQQQMISAWQGRQLLAGRREFFIGRYKLLNRLRPWWAPARPAGPTSETSSQVVDPADPPQSATGVYLASDPLGRLVVVKKFSPEESEQAADLSPWDQQGEASAALEHPNLVQILDGGHEGHSYYLVFEHVPGQSLASILAADTNENSSSSLGSPPAGLPTGSAETTGGHSDGTSGQLPIEWVTACIYQTALALDHAHRHRLLHRNLRPSSLVVSATPAPPGQSSLNASESPQIRVLDLSLADVGRQFEALAAHPHSEPIPGGLSLDYIAPEQISDASQAECRSDIYSLGCLFFYLLAGRVPFEGGTVAQRAGARLRLPAPSVRLFRSEVPPELDAVLAKALSQDPRQRHQTAGELAREIIPFLPSTSNRQGDSSQAADGQKTKTLEQFFSLLELSHVVTRDRVAAARAQIAPGDTLETVGERLVAEGVITRWQYQQLLQGQRDFYLSKYKLMDQIGRGATGTVYLADDPQRRPLALKVLAAEHAREGEEMNRFLREGRVANALDHPNICAVYAISQEGERHFLVMEYCEGQDLKSWVTEYEVLPISFACECIRQAGRGLDYAHQKGVVHRDIKPSNLLVRADDTNSYPQVKILDMGVAKFASDDLAITQMNEILGTPDFMAPEQAQDPSRADIRADIYSLGCTLYYLLTGEVPFEGDTAVAKLTARFKQDPPLLRSVRPDAPVELEAILAKMLCRDVNRRYQSPAEVVAELEPFGIDPPTTGNSISTAFQSPEVEAFYATLHRANLFPTEQLVRIRRAAVYKTDPRQVAKMIVEHGLLSRWQARQLLDGRTDFQLGDYQLLDLLGRGATGNVYKAGTPGGNIVALKVLSPDLLRKPDAVARFRREMKLVAAMDHPNLVTAYDAGRMEDQTHYIAMEFVDGRDLKHWLAQFGPLPVNFACECIRQASLGLSHAHAQGIVHRDIKPGNMLVLADNPQSVPLIKLLDLGFANAGSWDFDQNSLTKADQLLGTPDYMSPEQAENPTTADARSDIYSLGCTLFRLLTNRPPFPGENPLEKLNARLRFDAPRVKEFRPDVPDLLDKAVAKMLARYPENRYQTVEEVARVLAPFAMSTIGTEEAEEVEEPDVPAFQSSDEPSRGHWLTHSILGTATLVAAVLLYLFIQPPAGPLAAGFVGCLGLIAVVVVALSGRDRHGGQSSGNGEFDRKVELLHLISVEQHAIHGPWHKTSKALQSPDAPYARLVLPVRVPPEYALRLVGRRSSGTAALVVGLVVAGRQCAVTLDGWGGTTSGLGQVDGRPYDTNGTRYKGSVFSEDHDTEIICRVTPASVEVWADGEPIISWKGEGEQLSLFTGWRVPDHQVLFVGSHATEYLIKELELHTRSDAYEAAEAAEEDEEDDLDAAPLPSRRSSVLAGGYGSHRP